MRWALAAFVLLHALLHVMGFAKAFGLARLDALQVPIGRATGVAWLLACLLLVVAAVLIAVGPRSSGLAVVLSAVGVVASLVSQAVIVSSWSDAKVGTLPNLALLLVAGCIFAAHGPVGLRDEYRARSQELLARTRPGRQLSEASVASLPGSLRRYLVTRWSTPLSRPRDYGGLRIASRGQARWAPAGQATFAYIELELVELEHDPAP